MVQIMANISREESEKIDRAILDCLEAHTAMTARSVAIQLTKIAREQGLDDPSSARRIGTIARSAGSPSSTEDDNKQESDEESLLYPITTINKHLNGLIKEGKVRHQEQGFLINQGWKATQPNAYIFIITEYPQPKRQNDQCHKKLVAEIKQAFDARRFKSLILVSAEIIMGYDYDIIIVVYGDSVTDIGGFVLDYLQGHQLVKKTHTVMVWPSEYEPPADPDHQIAGSRPATTT
jgi:hypothetical protein